MHHSRLKGNTVSTVGNPGKILIDGFPSKKKVVKRLLHRKSPTIAQLLWQNYLDAQQSNETIECISLRKAS